MLISISYDYSNLIKVLVGANELRYTIHKDIVCAKSKFFRAACSSRWREGEEKTVRLPEIRKPKIFQNYVDWIHSGQLVFEDQAPGDDICAGLIDLQLLGDILDDVELRNTTIQHLASQVVDMECCPSGQTYHIIWDNTRTKSSLRR
jgi:hypothetical protein